MFGTALGVTPHSGLAQTALSVSPHRLFELTALAPQTPQTGIVLLDTALEVSLATQAGLLLTVPAYFQLAQLSGISWVDIRSALQPLYVQLQQSSLLRIQGYEATMPAFGAANQGLISTVDR